jgi:hypothetical protein
MPVQPAPENKAYIKYLVGAGLMAMTAGGAAYWLKQKSSKHPAVSNGELLHTELLMATADARLKTRKPVFADIQYPGGLDRVAIRKDVVSPAALVAMGFVPSKMAIPEKGQTAFTTYRLPDKNLHVHEHKDVWLVHKDRFEPKQMTALRPKTDQTQYSKQNRDHLMTDAAPALSYYLRDVITNAPDMEKRLSKEKR